MFNLASQELEDYNVTPTDRESTTLINLKTMIVRMTMTRDRS